MLAVHERSYLLELFVAVSACGEAASFTIIDITLLDISLNTIALLFLAARTRGHACWIDQA